MGVFPFPVPFTGPPMFGSFNPSKLFASNEPGGLYDFSDLSVMFQDAAGTTAAALEQPVGLVLDKSRGLVLGSSLSISGWTNLSGIPFETLTTSGSSITSAINSTSTGYCYTGKLNMVSGQWYKLTIALTLNSGTAPLISTGNNGTSNNLGSLLNTRLMNGSNTIHFRYGGDGNDYFWLYADATSNFSLTISASELPGNHLSQSTSTARPVLSARVNLLTQTEDFSSSVWNYGGIRTALVTNGTSYDTVTEAAAAAGSVTHRVASSFSSINGVDYTFSVTAKADARKRVLLYHYLRGAWFDLTTGQCGADSTYPNTVVPSMSPQSDGGYLCTMKFTSAYSGTDSIQIFVGSDSQTTIGATRVGDGISGILLNKADLRPANAGVGLPAYQRVGAATYGVTNPTPTSGNPDYDTTGFPLYLKFDGTDDSLSSAAIDFSATDKMSVFAGVRKIGSASDQILAEISPISSTNDGAFTIAAPASAVANSYGVFLRGTQLTGMVGSSYTAPITNVLSALMDLSKSTREDEIAIRVNGATPSALAGQISASAGSGNFGNHQLFVGARNNASVWLSGNLYSLIIRGALTDAATITSTETWVNGKTKAY